MYSKFKSLSLLGTCNIIWDPPLWYKATVGTYLSTICKMVHPPQIMSGSKRMQINLTQSYCILSDVNPRNGTGTIFPVNVIYTSVTGRTIPTYNVPPPEMCGKKSWVANQPAQYKAIGQEMCLWSNTVNAVDVYENYEMVIIKMVGTFM